MKVVTSIGYECEIDERVKTDWEFLKLLRTMQKNPSDLDILEKVFVKLLGKKGFEKLLKFVADKNDGFCDLRVISETLKEILSSDSLKKS